MSAPDLFVKLSVNFMDDPEVIDAGPLAEVLFTRGLQLAKRRLSDGMLSLGQVRRLSDDLDELAAQLGWERPLDSLLRVGLWTESATESGTDSVRIAIGGWSEWNESRKDVIHKAETAKFMNHKRWHVDRKQPDPKCDFCLKDLVAPNVSATDSVAGSVVGIVETESEAEVETEITTPPNPPASQGGNRARPSKDCVWCFGDGVYDDPETQRSVACDCTRSPNRKPRKAKTP